MAKTGHVKYLTPGECERLLAAAKKSTRGSVKKQLIISLLYKHGLRVSELCNMRLSDVRVHEARIYIRRNKGSQSGEHQIPGNELRLLRRYLREDRENNKGKHLDTLILTERGTEYSRRGIYKLVRELGEAAMLDKLVHPHMLRHACGYKLINDTGDLLLVQTYLGHRYISSTMFYVALDSRKMRNLFD